MRCSGIYTCPHSFQCRWKINFSNFITPPTHICHHQSQYIAIPPKSSAPKRSIHIAPLSHAVNLWSMQFICRLSIHVHVHFFSLKIKSPALTHFDHHGINNRPIHMVPRPTIIAIGLGLGPMWYLLPYIPVMPLLYGTTLKPWLSHGLVLFFVMHLFMLCLAKNKVLILYSYVKFAVESDSALVYVWKCIFRKVIRRWKWKPWLKHGFWPKNASAPPKR